MFDRTDLKTEQLVSELRRTVSDDSVLSEQIDFTVVRRVRRVAIGGTIQSSLERHARFSQIVWHHDKLSMIGLLGVAAIVGLLCVLLPFLSAVFLTALYGGIYAYLGVRRWTVLLAYPAALLQVPLFIHGLWRDTFVWGGRRYQWRNKFDVEVLD